MPILLVRQECIIVLSADFAGDGVMTRILFTEFRTLLTPPVADATVTRRDIEVCNMRCCVPGRHEQSSTGAAGESASPSYRAFGGVIHRSAARRIPADSAAAAATSAPVCAPSRDGSGGQTDAIRNADADFRRTISLAVFTCHRRLRNDVICICFASVM